MSIRIVIIVNVTSSPVRMRVEVGKRTEFTGYWKKIGSQFLNQHGKAEHLLQQ